MSADAELVIRPAEPGDLATVDRFVRELAEYEKLAHEVTASAEDFAAALFADHPRVFCDVAETTNAGTSPTPAGIALWYYTFSTFKGRHGIYLEDLFVPPERRGRGIGKALLGRLARRCVDERLPRLDWSVLDWNEPARRFYGSIGAQELNDWIVNRVSGPALDALANA